MRQELHQARERYLQRMELYKSFGYDRLAAVRFIVDQAEPVTGPVLDIGTGHGLLAIELARRGLKVLSVDVAEDEQRVAALNAEIEGVSEQITFLPVDAKALAFPDGAFACAATMDALHHLVDGAAVFSEMLRLVQPSGRIVLAELEPAGLALIARIHESEGRQHPVGPVTVASAVQWFLAHGLRLDAKRDGHLHSVVVLEKPA
jgi:2-polyprenyl-3-methyl-5-hydroxy-6-metoxy-1,4-benzoquinol methylase